MLRKTLLAAVALFGFEASASAATITWTDWSGRFVADNSGTAGVANGTAGSVGVTYNGNFFDVANSAGYPRWLPTSSYSGGTVDNAPEYTPNLNQAILLNGGAAGQESIVFSAPVVNPIFAFWSLGQGNVGAQFVFTTPVTFEGGGTGFDFGGGAITVSGNTVTGNEGNGVVQLTGTFSSVSFTTPVFENYYAFTVGYTSLATVVPEPISLALLGTGLVGLATVRRRKA